MPFAYLRDPLFLLCFFSYGVNRFCIKRLPHPDFFDSYFNDLICIPFFVPILVFAARTCRLRFHDDPPRIHEIFLPLLMWSVLFEIVCPKHPYWSQWVTGDPYDVAFYCVGACLASLYWQRRYHVQRQ